MFDPIHAQATLRFVKVSKYTIRLHMQERVIEREIISYSFLFNEYKNKAIIFIKKKIRGYPLLLRLLILEIYTKGIKMKRQGCVTKYPKS